jgi:Fe-S-cluster containining protein
MTERFDPYVPKEHADIRRSTPKNVIEQLSGPPDKEDQTCQYGSGVLIKEDLPDIAAHLGVTEDELKKKYLREVTKFNTTLYRPKLKSEPYGQCVFHDKIDGCSIHEVKPYQCKIATRNHHGEKIIEWFDVNFFVNPKDATSLREWHQRTKFKKTIPGASVEELVPDKEKRERVLRGEPIIL